VPIAIDARAFGGPDQNTTFRYGGYRWTTATELEVVDGSVRSKIATQPLSLTVDTPEALRVEVEVKVSAGGAATLTPTPAVASAAAVAGPTTGPVTLAVDGNGTPFDQVAIAGAGVEVATVTIVERFRPVPPGPVRVAAITLPSAGTASHHVDLTAFEDIDLEGWEVRWYDARIPGASSTYYTFSSQLVLRDGEVLRIYPGLSAAPMDTDAIVVVGGPGTPPPPTGAVFQLVDPVKHVAAERAAMGGTAQTVSGLLAVWNGDATRAFLVSASAPIDAGHYEVILGLKRNAGTGLPVWSELGSDTQETATLTFIAR
jgi:hypothetical protein